MNSISDAQPVQMKGGWRVVQALANTGGGREPYTQYLLWTVGRVLAQLPDSLHSQTRKRHAVFDWAMRAGAEPRRCWRRVKRKGDHALLYLHDWRRSARAPKAADRDTKRH